MATLVSVYIPTKNRLEVLRLAVDSVLRQTHKDLELIVVDDASSDATPDYLSTVAQGDSRVRVIRNHTSRGAAAARNVAITTATGEFVTGLDDDDSFLPDRLAAFLTYWNLLSSSDAPPACLYSLEILVNACQRTVPQKMSSVTEADLFERNWIGNQIFAPRAHYLDSGLFDETLPAWQDLEFFIRLLAKHGRARLLDMATYVFDATPRPDRISTQSRAKLELAFTSVADKHAKANPRRRQQLFLQLFGPSYQTTPTLNDFIQFSLSGIWPRGILRLIRHRMEAARRSRSESTRSKES